MSQKVKVRKVKWLSIVNMIDPNRKRPAVMYEFSNGRKFTDRGKSPYK